MPRVGRRAGLLIVVLSVAGGCNNNPFGPPVGQGTLPSQPAPQISQLDELQRRVGQLDTNNRDLTAQLARSQQQYQLVQDQLDVLRKQLGDTATTLQQTQLAKQEAEQKLDSLQTATRVRGGATLTANNSVRQSLEAVEIAGLEVRSEGDVIRIEIPADQLFQPGTSRLQPDAGRALDPLADALLRNYTQQRVGIEAHVDRSMRLAATGANDHQLSAEQALTIFNQLTQRNRIPPDQLFLLAPGANYPRYSAATPAGAARNRRIELVIYPERWSG